MFIPPIIIRSLPLREGQIIHGLILTPAKGSGDGHAH